MRIEPCSLVLIAMMLGCQKPTGTGGQVTASEPQAATRTGPDRATADARAASGATPAAAKNVPGSKDAATGAPGAVAAGAQATTEADPGPGVVLTVLTPQEGAQRETLANAGYQALLAPVLDAVHRRFAGVPDGELRLQAVALPADGRAVLVEGAGGRPLLVALDRRGQVSWFKERVVDDLDPSMSRLALCGGMGGDLVLVFHDRPTGSLAARRWDAAGGLLADFKLADMEHPDALAVRPWPGHGWLTVASGGGMLRAQLLTERGGLPWGTAGRQLGAVGVMAGPLGLVFDTDVSALIAWPGPGATGRHQRASRIDLDGRDLWKAPIDLGDAGEGAPVLRRTGVGEVRAELSGKSGQYAVNVTADGRVLIQ